MELPPCKWRHVFKYVKLAVPELPDCVLLEAVYGSNSQIGYRVWTIKIPAINCSCG